MTSQPATVPTATLGDGLAVSALGYGAMVLEEVYGEPGVSEDEALRVLATAVDAGVTFIDTADVYGSGRNEQLIGAFLRGRRADVTLATKFAITGNPADRARGVPVVRGDAAYVRAAVDSSLARLGTDVIDLYYMHRRDVRVPIEETVGAMADLVAAGKVRHLGLSEVTARELRAAHAVHPIAAVQSEWSIWSRDVERAVVPTAAELGIGFVPYSPLGRGFLAGAVSSGAGLANGDFRHTVPRFATGALEANLAIAAEVRSVAEEVAATPAQVALAWLLGQGGRLGLPVAPIPGTRRPERVAENAGALAVELSAAQLARLDGLATTTVGTRAADVGWVSQGRESAP